MSAPCVHVVVTVSTFRRPAGLAKLLRSLDSQILHPDRPWRLSVVVADNDAAGSGAATVEQLRSELGFPILYLVDGRQGIPIIRNSALDAVPEDATHVCFVDDDEWCVPGWIDAHLRVMQSTGAEASYGPVLPEYEANDARWIIASRSFEKEMHADGQVIGYAASNNAVVATAFLRRTGLRFDERMRFSGGSDFVFFNQAVRLGLEIRFAIGAIVYDEIPRQRLTLRYILRRHYRHGNTQALSSRLYDGWQGQLKRAAIGGARTGLGVMMLPALLVSPYYGGRALTHIFKGAGMVFGLAGLLYQEYAPDRLPPG